MKYFFFFLFIIFATESYTQNSLYNKFVDQGLQLLKQNNVEESIEKYMQALKIDPNGIVANYGIGVCYSSFCIGSGLHCSEAVEHFLIVEKFNKGYRNIYLNMVSCYLKIYDYEKAIEYCDKAMKQDSKNGESYFYRGFAYIQSGNKKQGCKDLNKALSFGYSDAKQQIELYCNQKIKK